MKLIGRVSGAKVYKTLHGRFRIFVQDRSLLNTGEGSKYLTLYNNPFNDGMFIHILFQWHLICFRGYKLERWGAYRSRTLVKKLK